MYIWYISLYEPLPVGGDNNRLMRSGMLAKALYERGHEVELWLPGFEHNQLKQYKNVSSIEESVLGFKIQYIKGIGYNSDTSIRRFIHNFLIARELKNIIHERKRKPDLIITQIPALELAYVATQYAKKEDIPIITDIRDPWPDIYKRLFNKLFVSFYYILFFNEILRAKYIIRNASSITAVSHQYLSWSLHYAKTRNTQLDRVFYIGYEPILLHNPLINSPNIDEIINLSKHKFLAVYVGTLGYNCDIETLINTAKILIKKNKNIQIVIAGAGGNEAALKKAELEYENLKFLGWLEQNEIRYLYKLADVGLATFPKDAMNSLSNKPFEYMAASLPLLSSLKGELDELICQNDIGFTYQAGNADDLSDKLLHLYDLKMEGKLANYSIRSKNLFLSQFSSASIYPKFSEHIETVYKMHTKKL
ncbi:MAG: glycosyltransferase family 4 protein [Methylococcaceae bacterium]